MRNEKIQADYLLFPEIFVLSCTKTKQNECQLSHMESSSASEKKHFFNFILSMQLLYESWPITNIRH